MSKITLLIIFLFYFGSANAQKELWGVNKGIDDGNPNSTGYKGNITKYDITGENPAIVHEFLDFATGKTPKGKLFLASNGKLYGITIAGGDTVGGNIANGNGALYEYDLILNKYRVVHYFNTRYGNSFVGTGLIEPIPGKLYGANANKIFSFDINTEVFTYLSGVANYYIDGELMKASNGNLYGMTGITSSCPGGAAILPNYGTIFKANLTTGLVQTVYMFKCDRTDGFYPKGILIEAQLGKLYGVAEAGGNPNIGNGGTVFEFDINTNAFIKKIDFDGDHLGNYPQALVDAGNGKLYGVCQSGGTYIDWIGNTKHDGGTLFEYTPSTNSIIKLYDFGNQPSLPESSPKTNFISIMRTSTGNYFGNHQYVGLFRYYPIDNSLLSLCHYCALPFPDPARVYATEPLIEICRKPSYHFFDVNTFDTCTGGNFTYDIQNTNATTYQWLKDGNSVPNQTTGILNLTNLAASDAGNYTCLLTNECGTTTTMVLHLTVNCLGTNTFADLEKSIKLYPNPTKDVLNIKLPENITVTINNIKIANSLGQIIREQKMQNNPTIDVGQLQNGIYFITLTTNYGVWNGKFVKE